MILTCHDDPVLAEIEIALSAMMAPADAAAWLERHLATLKVDTSGVWPRWANWVIASPRRGLVRIAEDMKDPRAWDSVALFTRAANAFLVKNQSHYVFANLFLALEAEAQRVGYEMVAALDNPAHALKDALRAAAYACAVDAFVAPHHAHMVVRCAADAATWPDRTSSGRFPWAQAAATALVEICEENL